MSTFNPSKIPMTEAEQARYDAMDEDMQKKYLRLRREVLYERQDTIDLFGYRLAGELEQERQATAKSADVTKQLQVRDTALWQALRAEHAELFQALDQARQAADEASYAAADAYADLDAHLQRKSTISSKDIRRYAARQNELETVHGAYEDVAAARLTEYEQAVRATETALRAAIARKHQADEHGLETAHREAQALRQRADAIEHDARCVQQDTVRLESRIRQYGISGIIEQEEDDRE